MATMSPSASEQHPKLSDALNRASGTTAGRSTLSGGSPEIGRADGLGNGETAALVVTHFLTWRLLNSGSPESLQMESKPSPTNEQLDSFVGLLDVIEGVLDSAAFRPPELRTLTLDAIAKRHAVDVQYLLDLGAWLTGPGRKILAALGGTQ